MSKERNPMKRNEETRCRICGCLLTVPESVKREIGPVCWGRLKSGEITEEAKAPGTPRRLLGGDSGE
jgi:hypothetical protein